MSPASGQSALPLFPLNTVVFPGGLLPLRIFEQRYLDMVKQAIADGTPFGICAIREGTETGTPAVLYAVGTCMRVTDWDMPQTGILHIDTRAQERFVIRSTRTEPSGLLVGAVEAVSGEAATAVPDDLELAVEILRHIINEYGDAHFPAPHQYDNAVWVGYRLSEVLPLKRSIKQNLLEMNDSVTRLRILTEFLKKHVN
ncbi:MAG: LON peptidase substrate-binding domain-containing protein [Candidatus Thermoplasmatota archaeon]|nr:LON peptidase substrate-binding domain-containing protein [Candidatus Thermoplasmatota archaeon]